MVKPENIFVHTFRWNDLISQSTATMKMLPLTLGSPLWYSQKAEDLTRKYQTIKIKNYYNWDENTLNIFSELGSYLRTMELEESQFKKSDAKVVNSIVAVLSKLEVLKCLNTNIFDAHTEWFHSGSDKLFSKPQNLPKLKSVTLQKSHWGVSKLTFTYSTTFSAFCETF